jgi:predicted nucleotidyltransferase
MRDNSEPTVERHRAERRARLDAERHRVVAVLQGQTGVRRVILFGSLARGAPGPRSDLDLISVQGTGKRFMDRLDEFYRLLTPRVAMDILVYTPAEWAEMTATRPFLRRAQQEGVTLYESHAA